MNDKKVVELKNLVKCYGAKDFQTTVLKGIDLTVYKDDFIAIMGPSGSGKTTLLNILSTIDKPTQGTVEIDGQDVTRIKNKELARLRKDKIGFVFQDYNLLDTMTLQDNIALPLALDNMPPRQILERIRTLAAAFGLTEQLRKYPYQLSGGQKQRGAVCRALITNPEIIFADEPTGSVTLVQHYPKQMPVIFPSLSTFISSMTERQRVRFSSRVKVSYIALKSAVKIFLMAAKSGGDSCAGSGNCPSAAVYIS